MEKYQKIEFLLKQNYNEYSKGEPKPTGIIIDKNLVVKNSIETSKFSNVVVHKYLVQIISNPIDTTLVGKLIQIEPDQINSLLDENNHKIIEF